MSASVLMALAAVASSAQAQNAPPPGSLAGVIVVGSTPLIGSDLDRDEVPAATQVLSASDINRTGIPNLTGAILSDIPSATINDTEGNVFQPDILFRGFTASPVAGTAEGLAVYVNGARFNDAFGDTVNWDLIPPSAIEQVNLEPSNPVFGLNALGGSVNIRLKDGFPRKPPMSPPTAAPMIARLRFWSMVTRLVRSRSMSPAMPRMMMASARPAPRISIGCTLISAGATMPPNYILAQPPCMTRSVTPAPRRSRHWLRISPISLRHRT
jgi:hypothetical protein